MKCVYHKDNEKEEFIGNGLYRVVQRGTLDEVKRNSGSLPSRVNDPWEDIGLSHASQAEAIASMYGRKPLKAA